MGLNRRRWSEGRSRSDIMAVGQQGEFVAVVNDTDPKNGGKSYSLKISGNNHAQLLGKKIGDTVDGIFVGEGEQTLSGFKLQITGGSDKTGTPLRRDLEGGRRQAILVTRSTGFKGHSLVFKNKGGTASYEICEGNECGAYGDVNEGDVEGALKRRRRLLRSTRAGC